MTFGAWLKSYFRKCGEVLKHPKLLLPTLILALVWIILGLIQARVRPNLPMKVLNFLIQLQLVEVLVARDRGVHPARSFGERNGNSSG